MVFSILFCELHYMLSVIDCRASCGLYLPLAYSQNNFAYHVVKKGRRQQYFYIARATAHSHYQVVFIIQ